MGRETRRAPMGFDWPLNQVWFGYRLDSVECQLCDGKEQPYEPGATYCPCCEGEGRVSPRIEPPTHDVEDIGEGSSLGWQMWETTSEGSPISPVCKTPEALAAWLADNGASSFGSCTATYDQWLRMIKAGWAPSAVLSSKGMQSGVEFVGGGS